MADIDHAALAASTAVVCKAICKSGKFETGEGGCAPRCMSVLGNSRRDCPHRVTVHGKLASQILEALNG